LSQVSELLRTVGDYEAQVLIAELLLRAAASPAILEQVFAYDPDLSRIFGTISKFNFEADARNFINELNKRCGENAKVWTYPCITAEVKSWF